MEGESGLRGGGCLRDDQGRRRKLHQRHRQHSQPTPMILLEAHLRLYCGQCCTVHASPTSSSSDFMHLPLMNDDFLKSQIGAPPLSPAEKTKGKTREEEEGRHETDRG